MSSQDLQRYYRIATTGGMRQNIKVMHLCPIFKYCIHWPAGGRLLTETVQVTVEWTELCWTEELWVLLSKIKQNVTKNKIWQV
jgi:hypothetical protein